MSDSLRPKQERIVSPEEAELLAQGVSVFMTKPENTDTQMPLLLILKELNLKANVSRKRLNDKLLAKLYPNIENIDGLVEATKHHMSGRMAEVFLVSRDTGNTSPMSVLDQVTALVGKETDPMKNDVYTLRNKLHGEGREFTNQSGNNIRYFENGFHRPRTSQELVEMLKALRLLEQAKRIIRSG